MAHVFTTGQVGGVEMVASLVKAQSTFAISKLGVRRMLYWENPTVLDSDRKSK